MIFPQDLDNWFSYHKPTEASLPRFEAVRAAARVFARAILDNTPCSIEQSAAIWSLRESVFAANASIACNRTDEKAGAA